MMFSVKDKLKNLLNKIVNYYYFLIIIVNYYFLIIIVNYYYFLIIMRRIIRIMIVNVGDKKNDNT